MKSDTKGLWKRVLGYTGMGLAAAIMISQLWRSGTHSNILRILSDHKLRIYSYSIFTVLYTWSLPPCVRRHAAHVDGWAAIRDLPGRHQGPDRPAARSDLWLREQVELRGQPVEVSCQLRAADARHSHAGAGAGARLRLGLRLPLVRTARVCSLSHSVLSFSSHTVYKVVASRWPYWRLLWALTLMARVSTVWFHPLDRAFSRIYESSYYNIRTEISKLPISIQ